MSTSYYVVTFHHSVKVVRKISRSGTTLMSRYSRQWLFGLQGHRKNTNTLWSAQNYNTGLEGVLTPLRLFSFGVGGEGVNSFCFLINVMYASLRVNSV